MKVYVKVRMKAEFIYDLLLFHTYSRLSGFLVNLLGLAVIITGGFLLRNQTIQLNQAFVYVAGGMMILLFTPINLRLQAARMMGQPRYDSEIQYGFDENGIEERLGEQVRTYGWDRVQKAVSTPKDIAFYIEESSALVLPKESFGENFMPVMKLVASSLSRDRIYIR